MSDVLLVGISFLVFLLSCHLIMRTLEVSNPFQVRGPFSRRALILQKVYLRIAGFLLAAMSLAFFLKTIWTSFLLEAAVF